MSDWTIILRSLRTRLFSTVTTSLTVAVAVALLLVLLVLRASAAAAFERGSGDMHLLISRESSPLISVLSSVFYADPPKRSMTLEQFETLKASLPLGGNGYCIPLQQGDSFRGFPVTATTPEFFTRFKPNPGEAWAFAQGRSFDKPFEVVLGSAVARATGVTLGDRLFLTHGISQSRQLGDANAMKPHEHSDFAYTVVGILAPTGGSHDRAIFTDLTSTWVIHAHDRRERDDPSLTTTTAQDLTPADQLLNVAYVRLATREGSNTPANLPQVFDSLRRGGMFTVASPADQIKNLFRIVSSVDRVLVAMAIVVVISSAIAIMLALYNSMEQRRRQIAILRVLGASRARIFSLVLTESALLGVIGAVVGVVVSLAAGVLVAGAMRTQLGLVITPRPDPRVVLGVALATVVLACLAGVIPAVVAYRTSVAKNLRPIG